MLVIVTHKGDYKELYQTDTIRTNGEYYYIECKQKEHDNYEISKKDTKEIKVVYDNEEYIAYQKPPTKEEIKERIKQEEIKELEEKINERALYAKDKTVKSVFLLMEYLNLIGIDYKDNNNLQYLSIPIIDTQYIVDINCNIKPDIREVIKKVKRAKEINASS